MAIFKVCSYFCYWFQILQWFLSAIGHVGATSCPATTGWYSMVSPLTCSCSRLLGRDGECVLSKPFKRYNFLGYTLRVIHLMLSFFTMYFLLSKMSDCMCGLNCIIERHLEVKEGCQLGMIGFFAFKHRNNGVGLSWKN